MRRGDLAIFDGHGSILERIDRKLIVEGMLGIQYEMINQHLSVQDHKKKLKAANRDIAMLMPRSSFDYQRLGMNSTNVPGSLIG